MSDPTTEALQQVLDKQAISEILFRYCRAVDRRDPDLLRTVYWPEAIDDHALFKGDVEGFISFAFPLLENAITQHAVTNILIDITEPDSAFSESYVTAFHDFPDGDGRLERTVGGRYLDTHERRGDEWRIISRTLVIDWYHEQSGNSVWDKGRYANMDNRGTTKPLDLLYRLHPRGPDM